LCQRGWLDGGINVFGGEYLVGRDIQQQVAAGGDLGRLRHLCGSSETQQGKDRRSERLQESFHRDKG